MPADFDLGWWMGSTIARLDRLERRQAKLAGEVRALRRRIESAFTWAQRVALLVVLWTGALGVNVDPARMADLVLEVLRLALRGG